MLVFDGEVGLAEWMAMAEAAGPALLWAGGIFSVLALLSTFIGLPWILTRMPADLLVTEPGPMVWSLGAVVRNAVGWVLIVLGVLMLVLPGQGVLTVLAGLVLADVPGKRRLIRWMLSQGAIRRGVDRLRERAGVAPLLG